MQKDYIIYFGHFELPDKNALAHRVKANAYAMKQLGYEVYLVGYSRSKKDQNIERIEDGDFTYYEVPYPTTIIEWLRDGNSYKAVEKVINLHDPDKCKAIFFTGVGAGNTRGLLKLSKRYHIPLSADIVDWPMKGNGNIVYKLIKYVMDDILTGKVYAPKVKNAICISSFLAEHYKKENKENVAVIPSLTYKADSRFQRLGEYVPEGIIRYCYVGNPGYKAYKDRIDWIVRAFVELNDENTALDIYGMEEKSFREEFPEINIDGQSRLVFHGKRPNAECIDAISAADYFVFARADTMITKAGFPTKFSECMAIGTPMITTPTSDLPQYVINGENGYISTECTYDSYYEVFEISSKTTPEQRRLMHRGDTKLDEFYWRDEIAAYLNAICK